jgi:chromosome segregation ATPase
MTILDDVEVVTGETPSSPRVKIRMLEQMAEALEDEAAGLYRRAATFEEEEFLLNRKIEERQTEINRLLLSLEALRSERDGVLEKIEAITTEAAQMREEVFNLEDEIALRAISHPRASDDDSATGCPYNITNFGQEDQPGGSVYFRRLTLADSAG